MWWWSVEDELRSLTVWGKTLLCSLVVRQRILLYCLPDVSRVNRLWRGGSCLFVSSHHWCHWCSVDSTSDVLDGVNDLLPIFAVWTMPVQVGQQYVWHLLCCCCQKYKRRSTCISDSSAAKQPPVVWMMMSAKNWTFSIMPWRMAIFGAFISVMSESGNNMDIKFCILSLRALNILTAWLYNTWLW